MNYIDLRSDSVTQPTQEMRDAMYTAPVGDDVFGDDPTVKNLEKLCAAKVGKEAGLFVASGTMGNQLAVMAHTVRGDEIIVTSGAHLVQHEASAAVLSGVMVKVLECPDDILTPDLIEKACRPVSDTLSPRTSLVCVENALSNGKVMTIKQMKDCYEKGNWKGKFVGTSNVYLAMKHDLIPVGTMAHEFVCAIGGMYGPQMANHIAMDSWRNTYRGALGTYLYDSFGWDIFSQNFSEDFANLFKGLRIDSGNNYEQLHKIIKKYKSLNIDPKTKQIIFSNALDTDTAIEIYQYAKDLCQPSFGIGTHFTNDSPGIKPMNIVIKLVAAKITESWTFYNDTCKISEDKGKHTGKPEVIRRFMDALHIEE